MVSVFLQLVLGVAIVAAGTADPATVVEEGLGLSNGGVSSEDLVPTKTTGYDFVVAIPDDIPDEIGGFLLNSTDWVIEVVGRPSFPLRGARGRPPQSEGQGV